MDKHFSNFGFEFEGLCISYLHSLVVGNRPTWHIHLAQPKKGNFYPENFLYLPERKQFFMLEEKISYIFLKKFRKLV